MDEPIDLLKIKIEKAKRELSTETVNAINAVDWKAAILGLRDRYKYTFEQLGNLELETELLLCGLVEPENYSKELENRMKISKDQANELVNEMNNLVFKKIREELIKNTEKKKVFAKSERSDKEDVDILNSAGIEIVSKQSSLAPELELSAAKPAEDREDILKKIEKPETLRLPEISAAPSAAKPPVKETSNEIHPILAQKLSSSFQISSVKTEHSLENITKAGSADNGAAPKIDPYREIPE